MAPIAVGDVIPDDTLPYFDEEDKAKTYPENKVLFLADGSAKYTHDLSLELDLSEKGLRTRFKRFTLRFNAHDSSKSDTPDEPSVLTLNYLSRSLQLQVLKSTSGISHLSRLDRESNE
ncbi:hypothetical protein ACFX11_003170 [Malus domestica]